jgi:hypothetical protein
MARDQEGRPIPVERPDPPDHQARMTTEQQQFLLVAQKSDEVMTQVADLARRVAVLELEGSDRLNERLADFERRFDAMMLARLTDFERRFDLMADAAREAAARPPPPLPIEAATS